MEHGRVDDYLESRKLNLDCKKAMEAAIRENFDGMHLAHDAAAPVLKEYGAERVAFVLANTVQYLEYDGRFSRDNKEWAKGFEIPENISRGMDLNVDYILNSYSAVQDGFIGLAREEILKQELRQETSFISLYYVIQDAHREIRDGISVALLSDFLGHASLETTRIYAYANTEMKRNAIEKSVPSIPVDEDAPVWDISNEDTLHRLAGLK